MSKAGVLAGPSSRCMPAACLCNPVQRTPCRSSGCPLAQTLVTGQQQQHGQLVAAGGRNLTCAAGTSRSGAVNALPFETRNSLKSEKGFPQGPPGRSNGRSVARQDAGVDCRYECTHRWAHHAGAASGAQQAGHQPKAARRDRRLPLSGCSKKQAGRVPNIRRRMRILRRVPPSPNRRLPVGLPAFPTNTASVDPPSK